MDGKKHAQARTWLLVTAGLPLAVACGEQVPTATNAPAAHPISTREQAGEAIAPYTGDETMESARSASASAVAPGVTISTVASGGIFLAPDGIAIDRSGNFIVPDPTAALLAKVSPSGVVTTVTSGPPLKSPNSVTLDAAGNFVVTDERADALFLVTASGTVSTIFSGTPLDGPVGVAVDAAGDFIVADFWLHTLFRITSGGVISTIASGAPLSRISGVINDGSGNFIVVGCRGDVFRVTPAGGVTVIASGVPRCPFNTPAIAWNGDVIVTTFYNGAVVRISPAGVVSTIFSGAPLVNPNGVVIAGGDLIVSDRGARAIFRISGALEIPVDIDIRPGGFPNSINPESKGLIPVAIFGSTDFDVADIDPATLAFGPGDAPAAHKLGGHFTDVNSDGLMDLVSHYRTKGAGLLVGDTEACVTGAKTDGAAFRGCDAVRVLN
jgi:sugar lactone lactonase YvrE